MGSAYRYTATRRSSGPPASSRAWRAMATRSRRSSGVRNAANSPSARAPAIRSRPGRWAATSTGGRGRVMGGGLHGAWSIDRAIEAPSGALHMASSTSRACTRPSVRARAGGKGYPYARCSAASDPVPMPSTSRPPLMTSSTEAIFAARGAGRYEADSTAVPSVMRSVTAATAASPVKASKASSPCRRPGVHRWSFSHAESNPSDSARMAASRRSGHDDAYCGRRRPTLRPGPATGLIPRARAPRRRPAAP